jgi:hypothetical protein
MRLHRLTVRRTVTQCKSNQIWQNVRTKVSSANYSIMQWHKKVNVKVLHPTIHLRPEKHTVLDKGVLTDESGGKL